MAVAGDDWFGEEEVEVAVQVVGFLAEAPGAAAAEDEAAEAAAGSEEEAAAAVVAAEADRRYTCPVQGFRANQVSVCENEHERGRKRESSAARKKREREVPLAA